jgi:hypothetical protein
MRYAFLGFGRFVKYLRMVRLLLLMGSLRSGKTLMSVALGYEFLRRGYVANASFNFPVYFSGEPYPRWTYSVLDEAGIAFEDRTSFKDSAKNKLTAESTVRLGKLGSYLVIPSFLGADKRFRRGMRMWRKNQLGNYVWIYSWELGPEDKEEQRLNINYFVGTLWLLNPSFFFNSYCTYFFPWPNLSLDFLSKVVSGDKV